MMALYLRGDVSGALQFGARGLSINPNDTEIRAEYGVRLALSGEWERGCGLLSDALARNPRPSGYYESVMALCFYASRDYRVAAGWIRKADVRLNPLFHFIAAAIYGQLQDGIAADREREWIEANAPELLQNIHREVAIRIIRPEDRTHFVQGLRLAGLAIPET
jgi:tetratricopeptide (TPR) repeat protein